MPQGPLAPIILAAERQRGGDVWVQLRLSDGRAGWVYLPAGELTDELLAEVEPALLGRLVPPAAVSRDAPGVPARELVDVVPVDARESGRAFADPVQAHLPRDAPAAGAEGQQ